MKLQRELEASTMSEQPQDMTQAKNLLGKLVDSPKGRGIVTDTEGVLAQVNGYWHLKSECHIVNNLYDEPAATGQPSAPAGEAGWYYSSVVQWMPEFSTEKINGYTGPFINQTEALEALFIELDEDLESVKRERDAEATKFSALSEMYDDEIGINARLRDALAAARQREAAALTDVIHAAHHDLSQLIIRIEGDEYGAKDTLLVLDSVCTALGNAMDKRKRLATAIDGEGA